MDPVRQNPIQRTVRSVQCSYVCAVHCVQLLHTILHRTDLIIFPFELQTITTALMMSIWGRGRGNEARMTRRTLKSFRWRYSSTMDLVFLRSSSADISGPARGRSSSVVGGTLCSSTLPLREDVGVTRSPLQYTRHQVSKRAVSSTAVQWQMNTSDGDAPGLKSVLFFPSVFFRKTSRKAPKGNWQPQVLCACLQVLIQSVSKSISET